MHGVDVWFLQVQHRVGPEIEWDMLLSCWNWRPGESEEDVSRPTSSSGPRRSGVGSAPPAE
ncbi:hypothetical protein Taro_054336 [Colocasia esculenta]|uniref:Uncharacterized protein n=1 Tax=Colocasia esculenta TaxID=4460 RepID=A0A843XN84_COLES|nr:hypothetical protein [Colocasia esculenta]